MDIDLSTASAVAQALARAIELRADCRAGIVLDGADLTWLADIAVAALLIARPADIDLVAWLAAADEIQAMPLPTLPQPLPEPPPWLRRMQEDFGT